MHWYAIKKSMDRKILFHYCIQFLTHKYFTAFHNIVNLYNKLFFVELINGYEVEKAQSYIEDCIAKHEPLLTVLRLMCLQSLCGNGLKQKLLDYYKTEVIQVSG